MESLKLYRKKHSCHNLTPTTLFVIIVNYVPFVTVSSYDGTSNLK